MPIPADLSLAVVDKEQVSDNENTGGICAYKLLQSELQGYIEDIAFYFKDDSCVNHEVLDLLLLTKGYRKFLIGSHPLDEQKFKPETSFDLSGKIKLHIKKVRDKQFNYQNINLSLLCLNKGFDIYQTKPDSTGHFEFKLPLFYDKTSAFLQPST